MKRSLLLLLISASWYSLRAQEAASLPPKGVLSPVTINMLNQEYSPAQRQELTAHPAKLAGLEYIYAASYSFQEGQQVSDAQRRDLNILQYALDRKMDERVTVLDAASGLYIELHSLQEMDAQLNAILGYAYFSTAPVPKLNEQ